MAHNPHPLESPDGELRQAILARIRRSFDSNYYIRASSLAEPCAAVIPVVIDDIGFRNWVKCIERLCSVEGITEIFGKSFVEFDEHESLFRASVDSSLFDLAQHLRPFQHALLDYETKIAISVFPPEGYALLGGRYGSLEIAIGCSLEEARVRFRTWIQKHDTNSRSYRYFMSVARRYEATGNRGESERADT